MEIYQLRYFRAIVNFGSMAAAAKALNITQPALSYAITQLEKELGMNLFERHNNKLKLNSHAFPLLETSDTVLRLLDDCAGQMRSEFLSNADRVYIGVCYNGALSEAICSYIQEYPSVRLYETMLFFDNACHALEIGAVDFMGTCDVLSGSKYIQLPVFQERVIALIPKNNPLAARAVLCLDDLKDTRVILKAPPKALTSLLAMETDNLSPEHGGLNLIYEGNDDLIALRLAEQSIGIILMPESQYRWQCTVMGEAHCFRDLVPVPFDPKQYSKTLYLTWMKNSQMNKRAKEVLSYLLEYYQNDPSTPPEASAL